MEYLDALNELRAAIQLADQNGAGQGLPIKIVGSDLKIIKAYYDKGGVALFPNQEIVQPSLVIELG